MSKTRVDPPVNHTWKLGAELPVIRPHSEAKHRVIQSYLERYVSVLTANPAREKLRLILVDGFAGGGLYIDIRNKEERLGSPMLMLTAMMNARKEAQRKRTKPFCLDIDYFFIEKNADAFEHLKHVIARSEFYTLLNDKIHLANSDFLTELPSIIEYLKTPRDSARAIFVLGQFGYAEVPLQQIRTILSTLKNAEVILTFAVDSLIDYLSDKKDAQANLAKIGISLPTGTKTSAKNHLKWRRIIQNTLHNEIPKATGAKYYTPFFIHSADAHRDFWLIHLSGHHRARDVMVGLHWDECTSFRHFGGPGLRMLGYDPDNDLDWTSKQTFPMFEFDDGAKSASQQELLGQLPEQVSPHKDGITFERFFAGLTNQSPVTSAIMREVLGKLAGEGAILIRDKDGLRKKSQKIEGNDDVIYPVSEPRLFTFT